MGGFPRVRNKSKAVSTGMVFRKQGEMCSVLLVDDHTRFREELRSLLAEDQDIDVIGAVEDGAEALQFLRSCQPHVIVLDLNMPRMNGIEAAGLIKMAYPEIAIIGLCFTHDPMTIDAFLRSGATAVLSKAN